VIIAAAAAKPMTVLRIVLTPLLLEKPWPYEENTAVLVALPRAAISVRGGRPPRLPRNLLLDHEHGGLYGAGAEPVQGFLAGVSRRGWLSIDAGDRQGFASAGRAPIGDHEGTDRRILALLAEHGRPETG